MTIRVRNIILAATATALAASASLYAQVSRVPVAQPVDTTPRAIEPVPIAQPVGTPVAVSPNLTPAQQKALYGPEGPAPGAYRLTIPSGCMRVEPFIAPPQMPYIEQENRLSRCNEPETLFFILPYPHENSFTIRSVVNAFAGQNRTTRPNRIAGCATVARAVVFGEPRVDYLPCDVEDDANGWAKAGARDQRFFISPSRTAKNSYRFMSVADEAYRCWDLTLGLLAKPCSDNRDDPNQRFGLERVSGGWPAGYEKEMLATQGWALGPDGPRRSVPVGGVDIPGNDSAATASGDDRGEDCQKICLGDTSCRAWTWTQRGFNGNPKPMCFIKTAISNPVNRGPAQVNNIFSGIVRP